MTMDGITVICLCGLWTCNRNLQYICIYSCKTYCVTVTCDLWCWDYARFEVLTLLLLTT